MVLFSVLFFIFYFLIDSQYAGTVVFVQTHQATAFFDAQQTCLGAFLISTHQVQWLDGAYLLFMIS